MSIIDFLKRPKTKSHTPVNHAASPDFDKRLYYFKCHLGNNKLAIITDNAGEKYFCEIEEDSVKHKNVAASLSLYDQKFKLCSDMSFYWIGDRLFLSSVYTSLDHRGKGLAKKLNSLSNFIFKDLPNTRIIGNYDPFNSTIDHTGTKKLPKEEIDIASRRFYLSNGYEFITLDEYRKNPENYPDITEKDFTLGPNASGTIITRKLQKQNNFSFKVENNVIYECESEEVSEPNS